MPIPLLTVHPFLLATSRLPRPGIRTCPAARGYCACGHRRLLRRTWPAGSPAGRRAAVGLRIRAGRCRPAAVRSPGIASHGSAAPVSPVTLPMRCRDRSLTDRLSPV